MGRIILVPLGLVAGLIAGQIAKLAFDFIWGRVSDEEPPEPEHEDVSLPLLAAALAIEGAIFRLVRGLMDREARKGYRSLTGRGPGEKRPEPTG